MTPFVITCLIALTVYLFCKLIQLTVDMWRLWLDDQPSSEDGGQPLGSAEGSDWR